MNVVTSIPEALCGIEMFCIRHHESPVTITFPEGDSCECFFGTDDWDDNGGDPCTDSYEERFVLMFDVVNTLKAGPNNDSVCNCVTISEKHMPSSVVCNGKELLPQAQ